ncbi:MAG TPA: LysR substrate-binding domain-containing protein, partial [Gemmatimonadaceae bacterium]
DIGVAGAYPGLVDDPLIASVRVGEDPLECALLATSHPLASRTWLTPADLADVPFLFIPRATHPRLYDTVMSVFDQIGLTPRIEGSFSGPRTIWRLAADSMGWSLGNRFHRTSPPAGLVAIPIEGLRIPAGIQLLWRRDEGDHGIKTVLDAFRRSKGAVNADL